MKRFGVLLALLVLGSLLMVGTGTVKADTVLMGGSITVAGGDSYTWELGNVSLKWIEFQVYPQDTKHTFNFYFYDNNGVSYVVNFKKDGGWSTDKMQLNEITEYDGTDIGVDLASGWHYIKFEFLENESKMNIYVDNVLKGSAALSGLSFKWDKVELVTKDTAHDSSWWAAVDVANVKVQYETYFVTFNLKDALTSQPLTGVTVKEGDTVLGTIDNGGSLELTKGTHTLTFEKSGYWSTTKTIDVQGDMSVSVEMYPDTAAVMIKNLPDQLTFYEHSTGEFSFTLSPIDTSATYDAYLSFTGLDNIVEVEKGGRTISPENGRYYLGDITGDTSVLVRFKTGSVGTYAFSMTVQSFDGAGAKTYTTTKQVSYKINPLPFSISFPSEWQVGNNQLRVSEASGSSYSMVVVLKDSSGASVWSDSYSFTPYEVHTFIVQVPKEGTYTLEFQWNGMTAEYSVSVGSGIKLLTTSITAKKGDVVSVQLSIKNSDVSTHYYTVELSGGFLDAPVNQTIAVPPSSEKTVSVPVQVPSGLQFDAYDVSVAVKEGDEVKYQGTVHFIIQGSAGFSLFGGGGSGGFGGLGGGSLLLIGGLALAGLVGVALLSRRR